MFKGKILIHKIIPNEILNSDHNHKKCFEISMNALKSIVMKIISN